MLLDKIDNVDFDAAKKDVINFIKNKSALNLWSADFFRELSNQLRCY